VAGDELGLALAEELERLAPFGSGNPDVSLLVPAARLSDARTMGEGKHVRFTVEAGGARARAVAFGSGRLPDGHEGPLDAAFALERNEWAGAVEPRLVLRHAAPPSPGPIRVVGEPADYAAAVLYELDRLAAGASPAGAPPVGASAAGRPAGPPHPAPLPAARRAVRDRRGGGIAGTVGALAASGEPVLVACADACARRRHLEGRLGGFALCSWDAIERDPGTAAAYEHLVALDPPLSLDPRALAGAGMVHLVWGAPEADFALAVAERDLALRTPLAALYRELRDGSGRGDGRGTDLEAALRGRGPVPRPPAAAARLLQVLLELDLVELDRAACRARILPAGRTDLERSTTFRRCMAELEAARRRLTQAPAARAVPLAA
jgi:single-stranded-DNA-specific exonuclease